MNFADAPSDPESRARAAFIHAASWPDEIRGDPRFYDDTRPDAAPTPVLRGFPGMQRHTNWHYADLPFSPDNTPLIPTPTPNVVTEIRRMMDEILPTADPTLAAYDLPWLEHLVADIHNPLHATSRFTKDLPQGDQGGNLVFVYGKTLHAYWDDAASPREIGYEGILKYAKDFTARQPPPVTSSLNPRTWLEESFKLAKSDVYNFGDENRDQSEAGQASGRLCRKRAKGCASAAYPIGIPPGFRVELPLAIANRPSGTAEYRFRRSPILVLYRCISAMLI